MSSSTTIVNNSDFSVEIRFDSTPRSSILRNGKGNSLIALVRDYVAIDIETTGLDPRYDEIIEIGAVRVRNGDVVDTFQTLVKPQLEIDTYITELTGITNDMLVCAPDISRVLPDLAFFIGNSILIGHSVSFDVNFLFDACRDHNFNVFSYDYIDTCRFWKLMEHDHPHHRLIDAISRYNLGSTVEHRALSDSLLAHLLYEALISQCIDEGLDFNSLWKSRVKHRASDIISTNSNFDITSPLYNKHFTFTGKMERMTRADAMQIVADSGGFINDKVTNDTNYLVIGNEGYNPTVVHGKSSKHVKAEQMKLAGYDIEVISENVFWDMLE